MSELRSSRTAAQPMSLDGTSPLPKSPGNNAAYYIGADQSEVGRSALADLNELRRDRDALRDMLRRLLDAFNGSSEAEAIEAADAASTLLKTTR